MVANEHNWYTIRTYAGREQYVKKAILYMIEDENLHALIKEVVVPTEDVIDNKDGKKRITERSLYSGYVFANMLLDSGNELVSKIQSLSSVSGFIGNKYGPTPLTEKDINKILDKVHNRPAPRPKVDFIKGEAVRINEGSFKNFQATVEEYDIETGTLKLNVQILGRPSSTELPYSQVEKIEED
jgi:transcriptional antiterminator NusG